jgi:hypothetical protein
VLAWLASRFAHLTPARPPGRGGTPPLPLEVRLDAVAAVVLDGLSYRRAGRMVGISKAEVGDSLDLLLLKLAALGYCQPDGRFVTTLAQVRERLAEMAEVGEVVCVDGLATRVQRPRGWANQKLLYDAKRHAHTAQGLAVSTSTATCCGWMAAGLEAAMSRSSSSCRGLATGSMPAVWPPSSTEDSAGWPRVASTGMCPVGDRRTKDRLTDQQRPFNRLQAGLRALVEQAIGHRANAWRCAAGAGCCTGCEMSSAPLARWSAWAGGCTGYPHERASRTPSVDRSDAGPSRPGGHVAAVTEL